MSRGRLFHIAKPKLLLYCSVGVGPAIAAASQFALSLGLLRSLSPVDFGSFSLMFVALQFGLGLSGALLCAPLPVVMAASSHDANASLRSLFAVNVILAAVACFAFLAIGRFVGLGHLAATLFALHAGSALVRWFGRTYAYAVGRPFATMWSDVTYGGIVLFGAALMFFRVGSGLDVAFTALLAGALLGLLPFGRKYWSQQVSSVSWRNVRNYGDVWRRHSGWSLTGVVTTEMTSNTHIYIVTSLYGPAAVAPIAASMLVIRPVQVAMNALMEFERARIAREIGEDRCSAAMTSLRFFRTVLLIGWTATAVMVAAVLAFYPSLVVPPRYPLPVLEVSAALWMGVALLRLMRAPESSLLQGAGEFRQLAGASVASSLVSVVAVFSLVFYAGPIWSTAGILLGEAVFGGVCWLQAHRWYRRVSIVPGAAALPARYAFAVPTEG
jgi:hypothetical protein